MADSSGDITLLLEQLTKGDHSVEDKLIPLVYGELHRLASRYMFHERQDHTLQPTALVNEAYLKLVNQKRSNWRNRANFFAVACQIMRRILLDHARGHGRVKRGQGKKISLDEALAISHGQFEHVFEINDVLTRLAKLDQRQARVVELRIFGGLGAEEIGAILNISEKTVQREWSMAKAWLYMQLKHSYGNNARELAERQSAV